MKRMESYAGLDDGKDNLLPPFNNLLYFAINLSSGLVLNLLVGELTTTMQLKVTEPRNCTKLQTLCVFGVVERRGGKLFERGERDDIFEGYGKLRGCGVRQS
jgi:hypothetical protein